MKNHKEPKYLAAIYVRLSKEDGDISSAEKTESNSISNQKDLIKSYLEAYDDIQIINDYIDDGYSGTSFERPSFQRMMEDIKKGLINCVVVKDLSRFGRDYIDAGKYIEKIFPVLGVRFIAINDQYDSISEQSQSNSLIIPFKNLINDAYARDISVKIRSHLEMKRKRGDFIGPFTPYGYMKSEMDRNQLVVDNEAAEIIRMIFKWKLNGYSHYYMLDKLNSLGILSPLEYKNSKGIRIQTSFSINPTTKWCYIAIQRILENEMYTGILIQGKRSTPNYKVKQTIYKDKEDWVRFEGAHEPIVSLSEYQIVQRLLQMDTRTSPDKSGLHLFSGIVECADCGGSMIRKLVPAGNKKYAYLVCSTNKSKKGCSSHQISEKTLEQVVSEIIKAYITKMTDMEEVLESVSDAILSSRMEKQYEKQIAVKRDEIGKYGKLKLSLYEDLADALITKEEYHSLKAEFQKRIEIFDNEILEMQLEASKGIEIDESKKLWFQDLQLYKNIDQLSRTLLIELVDKIIVHNHKRIEIQFRNQDYYDAVQSMCKEVL